MQWEKSPSAYDIIWLGIRQLSSSKKCKIYSTQVTDFNTHFLYAFASLGLSTPLPDNKILDWSNLKLIPDETLKWI